jgi:thioredoxin-related protein
MNQMILQKEISAEQVLAISIGEEPGLVEKVSKERNYQFRVAIDADGRVANLFKVRGTPTLIFIDRQANIRWLSSGISPLLGFRLKQFLSEDPQK